MRVIDDANQVIYSDSSRETDIVRRLKSFDCLDKAELKEADIHAGIDDSLFPRPIKPGILNLLMNAGQAIQGKGAISISTSIEKNRVKVAIADSGIGIAPADLAKVFDPGFTTKGVGVGTGLGLSICYQIMQDHLGKIEVCSEPGRGACFTVIFPANLDELIPDRLD